MTVTVTAKIKLHPNNITSQAFYATINNYNNACNFMASSMVQKNLTGLSRVALHKQFYYLIRQQFNLSAQMACSAIRNVVATFKTLKTNKNLYKKGKSVIPTFKSPYADLLFNRDYTLKNGVLKISTINGRMEVPYYSAGKAQYINGDFNLGTAKLVKKKSGWFLCIAVSKEVPEPQTTNKVGIDLGLNFLATVYDGKHTTFYNGGQVKNKRIHYNKLRQSLQSKNTKSSRKRLRAIGQRESRYVNDVNHCITKALVERYPNTTFIVEDLTNIRPNLSKVAKEYRYLMVSWPYADLINKLEYKAKLNGCEVVRVDPKYTSQQCPHCGHISRNNRNRSKHLFECKQCGYRSNDDRSAAMNIYNKV